jgi:alkanesulfonate monooxygenase SsuD/methylene tetrahydromethanopterin reductase-like flavin-dependent oxidoreductase (luciferase family)
VVCADTDERARFLSATLDLSWVRLRTGRPSPLASPEEALAYPYTPEERAAVRGYRALHCVGSPETVRAQLEKLIEETGADELMITTMIYSQEERLRSYELVAEAFRGAPAGAF